VPLTFGTGSATGTVGMIPAYRRSSELAERRPSDPRLITAAGSGDGDGGVGEIQQCHTAVGRRLFTEPGNHGLVLPAPGPASMSLILGWRQSPPSHASPSEQVGASPRAVEGAANSRTRHGPLAGHEAGRKAVIHGVPGQAPKLGNALVRTPGATFQAGHASSILVTRSKRRP
jgi:hypothetical protein